LPHGPGSITPPLNEAWQPSELSLLDNGTRLVVQLNNQRSSLIASYILFPNQTGHPTSESCRASVLGPVLAGVKAHATVVEEPDSTHTTKDGHKLAVASYRIAKVGSTPLNQENVFAFSGTTDTCFEIHLSKTSYTSSDTSLFDDALDSFLFEPTYTPRAADYGVIATLFFNFLHDFPSAAIYYQRAFDTLPKEQVTAPSATILGRITVMQLAMTYGITGDLARSRAINQAAIVRDPDFPMYYYELACADAEQGNAGAARNHLQQAFDRRKNMPPNLPMPDPTQDDSILKLKSNPEFWTFVQGLPRS
jgi:tetratricopeptide (TPR) repeat protein